MNDLPTSDSCSGSSALWNALVSPSNRLMWVCMAEPGYSRERLGHERRPHALVERDLLDHVAERHHVVGHRQRVGVAQVDLLLAGRALVVAELHRDAHLLQRVDGVPAEVGRRVVHGLVEVAAVVGGHRHRAVVRAGLQQEELDLGVHVAGEAEVAGLGELAAQHVPRVGPRRRAVGHGDVAEHPRRVVLARRWWSTAAPGTSTGRAAPRCRIRRPGRSPRSTSRRSRCPPRRRLRVRRARSPPT